MSTNAFIIYEQSDGGFASIYSHWDGHPDTLGKTLVEHYDTNIKISRLISYGDVSELNDTLDESVFYHRDKNEEWEDVEPMAFESVESAITNLTEIANAEYFYVHKRDAGWVAYSCDWENDDVLTEVKLEF
ncbi:MAG: hypothetical protein R8M45_05475 [Ghiorsea sp.]